MSLTIRPVRPEDRPEWEALWRGYLHFYETEVSPDVYDAAFSRLVGDDPHDFHGLVAETDGELIGLTHFLFHRHMWKLAETCYLQDLYAAPEHRGLGVGRALIEAVYGAADAYGADGVYWLTQDFNTTARQLYDRVGKLTPFVKYTRA
ncbi:GNAT family N-acetyltransferase [Tranquillimonas rosea]|uniref:GNAT family N-acetyltransferase n=1 Tax=Tranquillimonas rosea TaxID=641238 RepID=UPI003BAD4A99